MKYLVISLVALNIGCASMPDKVFNKIHKGDSATKVADLLGRPVRFSPAQADPTYDSWLYLDKEDACVIIIKNDTVRGTKCGAAN